MNVMKNLMAMRALASAVCLVSCSSDDEMNVNNDGQVRFTAAIGNEAVVATPGTRASGTTSGAERRHRYLYGGPRHGAHRRDILQPTVPHHDR